jgi:hypothetical protein
MRLINCSTLQLEEFFGANIPDYVILSHRWEDEEVSFADFTNNQGTAQTKRGFRKIDLTCRQALEDGWQYAWVDTCCIDKSSSAELSEAINSMFGWYESSKTCYVYLSDVREAESDVQFPASKWFTRGWTLQELLAPKRVEFFDQDWKILGTKWKHAGWIATITGIDKSLLARSDRKFNAYDRGTSDVQIGSFCVAQRMSWASRRTTTRVEDTAYALLGIFDINMPLLYGEGSRAFTRLQEEILRKSGDNSILAWGLDTISRHPAGWMPDIWSKSVLQPAETILASSPKDFKNCGDLVHVSPIKGSLLMTSVGLQVELPVIKKTLNLFWVRSNPSGLILGLLSCSNKSGYVVGIPLRRTEEEDTSPLRAERQRYYEHGATQWHSAVLLGPRVLSQTELGQIVIVREQPPANGIFDPRKRRSQICLNESDALQKTGYSCVNGKALMIIGIGQGQITAEHWDSTSKVLSFDSGFDCELLLGFRFLASHLAPVPHSDAAFTLFAHTGHKKTWVFPKDLQRTVEHRYLNDQMENNSIPDNTQELTLYDRTSWPFKLRVTFEEKEVFRWRIIQINVDAEYLKDVAPKSDVNHDSSDFEAYRADSPPISDTTPRDPRYGMVEIRVWGPGDRTAPGAALKIVK